MFTRPIGANLKPSQVDNNYGTAVADTAVVITLAAKALHRHVIHGVQWSYTGGTPAGSLTITDGGVTVFSVGITANGPGGFIAVIPGSINSAVVITLAAGGASIIGKLNLQTVTEPG